MKNKILVTGGAGGIGSVISKSFAEQGAKVIVHYNHSKDHYKCQEAACPHR